MIIQAYKNNATVYLCGNGGSASDCQHIAGELLGRFLINRPPLPAVSLTADSAVTTAIANDFGYENVFKNQIQGIITKNDILWCFSTSGTSKNIINAANTAKKASAKIIAFTGKKDTPLEKLADAALPIPAPNSYSAQQSHQIAYHTICRIVEHALFA
jgi:D-sedoheptulose 7-phosphate isomerase